MLCKTLCYEYKDTFYAESANSKIVIGCFPQGSYNYTEEEKRNSRVFSNLSYTEKCSIITEKVADFAPCVESESKDIEELKIGGALTLYNPMGQYNYNMCWAACVATVVNYKQKTSLNPFEVCQKMGVPYDTGGSVYNIRDALNAYGVVYSKVRSKMLSWSEVKDNIDNKHPIVAILTNEHVSTGHSVVAFGYTASTKFINFWDPQKGSTGDKDDVSYIDASSNFYGGTDNIYKWEYTVSKK